MSESNDNTQRAETEETQPISGGAIDDYRPPGGKGVPAPTEADSKGALRDYGPRERWERSKDTRSHETAVSEVDAGSSEQVNPSQQQS